MDDTRQVALVPALQFTEPTIAMVNGYCSGGAFTQLVACDIAIAADTAQFGLSEINWGVIPGDFVSKVLSIGNELPRQYVLCIERREKFGADRSGPHGPYHQGGTS